MCEHCGCGEEGGYTITRPGEEKNAQADAEVRGHEHEHLHTHHHPHSHPHQPDHVHPEHGNRISIETDVLQKNNLLAQRNRGYFEAKNIMVINLVSSPGSGKTTMLERTLRTLTGQPVQVIEGDQQTTVDAERIHSAGVPVVQVNTGNGCHLDAEMIHQAVKELQPQDNSLLIIENVGNLVCPALFDLGEHYRIIITSVTEGEDKPLKYPNMFEGSHLCLINKIDLLPYVDFDMEKFKSFARKVNPSLPFIPISAKSGEGFGEWTGWLEGVMNNEQ